uniref:Knr4/Smi1-like domain-containing protein n=1 Tax=Corethron hystrix TaxID=216773 RepID=A0A7S1B4Y1_9STRA|mmetsp:Transcript_13134/g.28933  ORF Transcript_13134/g.28933 Transcript_13134/m.28933 type:complete len:186 (+) Transcript_13134:103-660(+)|eukprot:CAMPEP_0113307416 /NCGR_PEP_ID=MMETSP0010_2-20120614/6270_1 /TAXON_ID=216773 ORGANISM="Corethron hystrix, Strain 308" /NCGR_SAMPLE_ID=MMETSP0010_2 /ASSEMBLY_ACC=CAM_ASM_000155 /LENGTH=185 /DNA_ID=CAMNT_0000162267 /DNA_START=17 /DNA_END=574 /DNA_ORIENTATION=- /assembly_acc=CAM_ASM_000155
MSEINFEDLLEAFEAGGECSPPLPDSDVSALVAPESLRRLLRHAGEWHLTRDHCGVFGLNLFSAGGNGRRGPFFDKRAVFGDADLAAEWGEEHPVPNCGREGWECFAVSSEYDYLFVCVDPETERFGETRRVTNNCDEDAAFTEAPFDHFLERVAEFAAAYRRYDPEEDEDEEGPPEFIPYFRGR